MWVILKTPWNEFPAGHKLSLSDERAWRLLDKGIAAQVERPKPESKEADLTEALGIPEAAPARKPGRPRHK
jgi:hypothetical protein